MYTFPLVVKGDDDVRLFSLHTVFGPVIVLFSDQRRKKQFGDLIAPRLAREGKTLAFTERPLPSVEEAVEFLIDSKIVDPGQAQFITDSDPLFDRLLQDINEGALG